MRRIFLKFNEVVLTEIPLDRPQLTIGRKPDNDLVIDNPAVSGHHAWIFEEQGTYFIEDLGSVNGTFVNDEKVQKHQLQNTDRVVIGKHVLVFQDESTAAQPSPQSDTPAHARAALTPPPRDSEAERTMVLETKKHRELLKHAPGGVAPSKGEKVGFLSVAKGQTDRKDYELTGRMAVIGTEPTATVRLTGWMAPKKAVLISRRGDGYFLSTTEKGKKVLLNGEPIQGNRQLQDGDVLEVAGVRMLFSLKDQAW
jgi:hypothetical protein